jgi:hypothetical protein
MNTGPLFAAFLARLASWLNSRLVSVVIVTETLLLQNSRGGMLLHSGPISRENVQICPKATPKNERIA